MIKNKRIEEVVASLNIIDDTLFQKMAEDIGFCEELLSTVLQQNVNIESVVPQNSLKHQIEKDSLSKMKEGKRKCVRLLKIMQEK